MSIDLEDYFCDLPFSTWDKYESRIIQTTEPIIDLFEKYDVKATFFTVGYIAEKFPALIKKIHDHGHEIASHSYHHYDLRKITKEEFEKDLVKSIKSIESITGEKVFGFRAPYFSVNKQNLWVFDVLRKYLKYDSSVFPVQTPLYGMPDAHRTIYHPAIDDVTKEDESEKFIEIPPLTYRILSKNIPMAGGFYFRFFPYFLVKKALRKFNQQNHPAMFYMHPKDLDQHMPKISEYAWHYYFGKKNINSKFKKLLNDFKFTSVRNYLKL
jgi:polysaccharide deacetylase family protein (PEP-CTERM system associated)